MLAFLLSLIALVFSDTYWFNHLDIMHLLHMVFLRLAGNPRTLNHHHHHHHSSSLRNANWTTTNIQGLVLDKAFQRYWRDGTYTQRKGGLVEPALVLGRRQQYMPVVFFSWIFFLSFFFSLIVHYPCLLRVSQCFFCCFCPRFFWSFSGDGGLTFEEILCCGGCSGIRAAARASVVAFGEISDKVLLFLRLRIQ